MKNPVQSSGEEKEILQLVAGGFTNPEIAGLLATNEEGVDNNQKGLMKRTRLNWTFMFIVIIALPFMMKAQSDSINQPPSAGARAYTWYFGENAGLDFSGGAPVPLTNSAMESFECAGAMSDLSGHLLFYTNGGDFPYPGGVWNRNNQLMPNGITVGRGGCNSSEQGAMIVPCPRSTNLYYLFTTDCMENNGIGGLRYSIIDMNADGGLGDVVVAAQKLTTPTDESLAVIQHANGLDWWIVAHKLQTDSFFVYQFNGHGIVGVVKTRIGNVTPYWAGALKATTDGSKLVYAGLNWTSLFDFDNATGIISNYCDLNLAGYTAAFSDNCRYLYVATGKGQQIYQYDLTSTDITNSKTLVASTPYSGYGGIAIGPDNKIYCSRFLTSKYLGVINNPDLAGTACNYVDSGIYLGGKLCQGGLPNFPNTMLGGCVNDPLTYNDPDTGNLTISLDSRDSHHATISWTDPAPFIDKYMVMYREEGQNWLKIVVNSSSATLENLKAGTKYEIRVVPLPNEITGYEPLTDHFLEDDLATSNTAGTAPETESAGTLYVATTPDLDFDLFPNPLYGATINVAINEDADAVTIKITDVQGRLISRQEVGGVIGHAIYQLATDQLPSGIYNVQVTTISNSSTKKLVVVK